MTLRAQAHPASCRAHLEVEGSPEPPKPPEPLSSERATCLGAWPRTADLAARSEDEGVYEVVHSSAERARPKTKHGSETNDQLRSVDRDDAFKYMWVCNVGSGVQ